MAIIYNYPLNSILLAEDMLIGTSTKIVNGQPKNATKNFSIADLTGFIKQNVSLNDVLLVGNTSSLDAKIGKLYLYDIPLLDYGSITLNQNRFSFNTVTHGEVFRAQRDMLSSFSFSGYRGSFEVGNITANRVWSFPNKSGTVALLSDVPVSIIPTLQQVLDNNHDLVDGNNFQGTGAGVGNTGLYEVIGIGASAAKDNTGNYGVFLGRGAGNTNQGSEVAAIGSFAAGDNIGNNVAALGQSAAFANRGYEIVALGSGAALQNLGNQVNAFGNSAGLSNTFNNVNLLGEGAQADENGQTVLSKDNTIMARISTNDLTATRKYNLPDADGTIALLSDIPPSSVSPLTTKGDIYTYSTVDARLPVGLDTQVLLADSTTPTGLKWATNTAPTPLGYYGAFSDVTDQFATVINTGYPMLLGVTDLTNGVTIVSGSRVTIANTGIYNIQWSGQLRNPTAADHDVTIWLRKNGVDVPGSAGVVLVPKKHGSFDGHTLPSWNYLLDAIAGDYYEFVWSTENLAVFISFQPAGSPAPSTASVILTVTQQSGIMAGTGITAINSLTSSTQTMVVGTGGTNFNIASSGSTHTFNLLFNIRRNANNSSNNNINYNGYAVTGSAESSAVWTITRLTISASGAITIATATNVAWTNRESATYI